MVVVEPKKGTTPSPQVERLVEMAEQVCLDPAEDSALVDQIAELTSEAVKTFASCSREQRTWFVFLSRRTIDEFNPRYNAVMAAANYVARNLFDNEEHHE